MAVVGCESMCDVIGESVMVIAGKLINLRRIVTVKKIEQYYYLEVIERAAASGSVETFADTRDW